MITKTKWVIDKAHSVISFKVRHLMITNVTGYFKEYKASIYTTGEDFLTAEIDFWLDPDSIDTRDESRDKHLRSTDFFDVENHREITFRGNTVEAENKKGMYELWGDLTIRGITKRIKLDVEMEGLATDPTGKRKAGFLITGNVNRKDWNIQWNAPLAMGGVLVGDMVQISCEVQVTPEGTIEDNVG